MAVNEQAVDIQLRIGAKGFPKIIFTNTLQSTPYNISFQSTPDTRKNRFIGDVIKDGLKEIPFDMLPSDWQGLSSHSNKTSKSLLDTYYDYVDGKTKEHEKSYLRILKTTAEGDVNNEMKILSEQWVVRETGSHPDTLSELPQGRIKCNDSVASYLDPASPLDSDKVMGQRLNVNEDGDVSDGEPLVKHMIDMGNITIDKQFFDAMGFPAGEFYLNVDNIAPRVPESNDNQYIYSYNVNVNIANITLNGRVIRNRIYEKNRFKTQWNSNIDSKLYKYINGPGKGNVVKNQEYIATSDVNLQKLILGFKEIGDVFQVLMYYIWFMWLFHLAYDKTDKSQGKDTNIKEKLASQLCMITTDHVVYTMCKDFELTCIYTGSTAGLTSGRINLYKYQNSNLIITPDQYGDKITSMANSYYGRMKAINRRIQMGLAKMRIDTKNTWMLPLLEANRQIFFLGNSELRTLLSNRNPNIFKGSEKHKEILDLFKEEIDAIYRLNAKIEQTIAYEIEQYTEKLVKDDNSDDEANKTAKFNYNKGEYDKYCAMINNRQETPDYESQFISPVKLSFCKMYQAIGAIKPEMILLLPNTDIYKQIIERITTQGQRGSFIYNYSSSWNIREHGDEFNPLHDSYIPTLIADFVDLAGRIVFHGGGDENPPKSPRSNSLHTSPNSKRESPRPDSPFDNLSEGHQAAATELDSVLGTDDGNRTPDSLERGTAAASNVEVVTPVSDTSLESEGTPDNSRQYSHLVKTLRTKFSTLGQSEELAKLVDSFKESLDENQSQPFSPTAVDSLQSQGHNPENKLENLFKTIASMEEELFIYYLYEEIAGYATEDIELFIHEDNEETRQKPVFAKLKEKSKLNPNEDNIEYTKERDESIDKQNSTLIESLRNYKHILDRNYNGYIGWITTKDDWWVNINNPFVGSFDTDEDNSYYELILFNKLYRELHTLYRHDYKDVNEYDYINIYLYFVATLCYDFIIYKRKVQEKPMAGASMFGDIEGMYGGIGNISKKHNKTSTRNRKYNTYKKYLRLFSSKTPRSQIRKRSNSKKTRKYKKAKARKTRKTKK